MKIFKNILRGVNGNSIKIIKQPITIDNLGSTIIGYDIKNNRYVYFKIIPFENFNIHYYVNPLENYYFCSTINNELIFPKLSGCKKLFVV